MAEFKIKINLDGKESTQTINDLNKSLDELKKSSNLEEGTESFDKFNDKAEELQKTLKDGFDLNLNTDELNKQVQSITSDLSEITGKPYDVKVEIPPTTFKSYAELRKEATALREELERTDPKTDRYKELEVSLREVSTESAVARDRINDFNDGIRISTGSPIEQFKNSLALTREGLLNLDFPKVTTGFAGIKTAVSGLLPVLSGLQKAIIATGIGALIVAIGLLIANFDDLKAAIFGISSLDEANLKIAEDRVATEKEKLDLINSQDNTLRLQGKTEKEILELKKAQTEEVIQAQTAQIELQKVVTKQQEEAAKRNREILKGILDFISIPLQTVLKVIDAVTQFVDSDLPSLADGFNDLVDSGLDQVSLFNPEKTRLEGEATQKELEKTLIQLKNQRDGFELSLNKTEQDRIKKSIEDNNKYREELRKLEEKYFATQEQLITQKYQKELDAIKGNTEAEKALREAIIARRDAELVDISQTKIDNEAKTLLEIEKLRANSSQELLAIETRQAELERDIKLRNTELTESERVLIIEQANQKVRDLNKKFDAEAQAIVDANNAKQLEAINKQAQAIQDERSKLLQFANLGIFGSLERLRQNFDAERNLVEQQYDKILEIQRSRIESNNQQLQNEIELTQKDRDAQLNNVALSEQERADIIKRANDRITQLNLDFAKKNNEIKEKGVEDEKAYQERLTQIAIDEQALRNELVLQNIGIASQAAQDALAIIQQLQNEALEKERDDIQNQLSEKEAAYEREKQLINENIKDEQQRVKALSELDKNFANQKNQLEKQDIELTKKQIKRDRNAAIANIVLANAVSIAKAAQLATTAGAKTGNVVAFALTLASVLASIGVTIAQAKRALKEADSSIGALGGSGGGGDISIATAPPENTSTNQVPQLNAADGINPANFNQNNNNNQPTQPQQFVSVVEIDRVRNSVQTVETANTIVGGG